MQKKYDLNVQTTDIATAKYANLIYSDFCMASSKQLKLVPIDMGYGDPASNKFIPKVLLNYLVNELKLKNAGAYPDIPGEKKLIEKFKEFSKIDEGLSYDYHIATVTGGGRSAITNILNIFVKPKDVVLIPYPAWSGYKSLAKFLHANIMPIHTSIKNRFVPSAEDIKSAIKKSKEIYPESDVKVMILNTPHNPTGTIYPNSSIEEILQVLHENNIVCLADYTYRAIRDKKTFVPSVHKVAEDIEYLKQLAKGTFTDNIIAMQTLGKVSLTPGFRIGYVSTTNADIIKNFCAKKQATDFSGNLFMQRAFANYLLTPDQINEFEQSVTLFEKRRNTFIQEIKKYSYSPEKGNIILNNCGFYISFEIPKKYQKSYPLPELDKILENYPFIQQNIAINDYKSFFKPWGYVPSSEIFVLELIKNTAINVLPGHLFCSANQPVLNEYQNWVRVALIQDEESIQEAFRRIEKQEDLIMWQ